MLDVDGLARRGWVVFFGTGGLQIMLTEALAALASAGGTALVTDGWEGIRERFALLLGRGETQRTELAADQMEQARTVLAGLSGAALEQVRVEQVAVWRIRLADLLAQHPTAEAELRSLVADLQAQVIGSAGRVEQHAAAFDRSQQAVLGHGVQHVQFGGQDGCRPAG